MRALVMGLFLVGLLAVAASAQGAGRESAADPEDSLGVGRRAPPELRQRLDDFRKRRLSEALQLDARQTEAVDRELLRFRDRQLEIRRERGRLLEDLRRRIDAADRDEAGLRQALDALRENQDARERALADLKDHLSRELTVEQQARLALFAERFQSRMAEGLQRIRERRQVPRP